jgi:hypothetical protein
MEEKTILFVMLGAVVLVAVIGFISAMNAENTGMGIYIQPGQFQRGLAIRQLGSGWQDSVSMVDQGGFVTAGESQSPSAQSKHITPRIPGAYGECMPRDESGNFIYDAKGVIMVGWEVPNSVADNSNILRCATNYFKDVSYQFPDSQCCWNSYESMLSGSTGAAYRS